MIGNGEDRINWRRERAIKAWKRMYKLRYEDKWPIEKIAKYLKHDGKRYSRTGVIKGINEYRAIINLVH